MSENQQVWNRHYLRSRSKLQYPDENVVRFYRKSNLEPGSVVLDLGCGSGRHRKFLEGEGYNVIGQDFAAEDLQGFGSSICARVEKMPFRDESFDSILCWGVIHYLAGQLAVLAVNEIKRCLKPGGLLFATLRAREDSHLQMVLNSGDLEQGSALLYTEEEARDLFRGFSSVETGFILRRPPGDDRIIAHYIIKAEK